MILRDISYEKYIARLVNNYAQLAREAKTLEEMKQIIDDANDRAAKLGYKRDKFCIVRTQYDIHYDEYGILNSTRTEERVEVYPA